MSDTANPPASDLPPSAKFVLDVLEREGPLPRQDLQERTDLPQRTLDRAIDRLQNGGYIYTARDSDDLRVVVCHIDD